MKNEEIDIIFLTETDTRAIKSTMDYQIEGYSTILPVKSDNNDLIRIVCLLKNELKNVLTPNLELMDVMFPSIWMNYKEENGKKHRWVL